MPPRNLQERTRLFALAVTKFCRTLPKTEEAMEAQLGTVFEEADECVDCLEGLRDARIKRDDALIQEARELASIFAKSVSTARKNTRRSKDLPNS